MEYDESDLRARILTLKSSPHFVTHYPRIRGRLGFRNNIECDLWFTKSNLAYVPASKIDPFA